MARRDLYQNLDQLVALYIYIYILFWSRPIAFYGATKGNLLVKPSYGATKVNPLVKPSTRSNSDYSNCVQLQLFRGVSSSKITFIEGFLIIPTMTEAKAERGGAFPSP